LPLYNLDAQSFLLTAQAALYTLQYGLARDPKREHCVADGKEVLPGILLNRALMSSVSRMRQGAPGVSCSPPRRSSPALDWHRTN
jgi:hypothetical protein